MGIICVGWVVAPLLAIFLTCLLILAVCNLTLNLTRSFQTRILWLTVFTAFATCIISFMFTALMTDDNGITAILWMCLGLSAVVGLFVTRIILVSLVKPPTKLNYWKAFIAVLKFWSAATFEEMLHA